MFSSVIRIVSGKVYEYGSSISATAGWTAETDFLEFHVGWVSDFS
jgi:hypothetical protein